MFTPIADLFDGEERDECANRNTPPPHTQTQTPTLCKTKSMAEREKKR